MTHVLKKIAVLTSGGDAPGMNAAIRAVVRTALGLGVEVEGITRGYNGLINDDMQSMELRSVSGILERGGTILYTARSKAFQTEEGMERAYKTCLSKGIEALVVIGGDGSFRGAKDFSRFKIPSICIPGTIDNDIASTSYTIGYDTAMNTATEMIDKLRDTAQSHDRCSIVEVMGRDAGHLAVNVGISCGATAILIPEVPYDFERDIIKRMILTKKTGKRHFIIIVAEGVKDKDSLAKKIEEKMEIETRLTVLGHVQRGGSPSARDRIMASIMGEGAVKLLVNGYRNRVVAIQNEKLKNFSFDEAFSMKKRLDLGLYKIAHEISI